MFIGIGEFPAKINCNVPADLINNADELRFQGASTGSQIQVCAV